MDLAKLDECNMGRLVVLSGAVQDMRKRRSISQTQCDEDLRVLAFAKALLELYEVETLAEALEKLKEDKAVSDAIDLLDRRHAKKNLERKLKAQ